MKLYFQILYGKTFNSSSFLTVSLQQTIHKTTIFHMLLPRRYFGNLHGESSACKDQVSSRMWQ